MLCILVMSLCAIWQRRLLVLRTFGHATIEDKSCMFDVLRLQRRDFTLHIPLIALIKNENFSMERVRYAQFPVKISCDFNCVTWCKVGHAIPLLHQFTCVFY